MNLIFKLQNEKDMVVELKNGKILIDEESLTISQGFDNMLIAVIDKLLVKNKIDRLSLKSFEIRGKLRPEAVSSMVIKSIMFGLES